MTTLQDAMKALEGVDRDASGGTDVETLRIFLGSLEEEWGIAHPSTLAKPQKVANRLTALARAEFLIRKRNLPRQPVVRYVSKWTRG